MATGDLITLQEVRDYLRLEDSFDDAWLAQLITSTSSWFRSELGRDILAADYVETFDGDGSDGISLGQFPVTEITSVVISEYTVPARGSVGGAGWVRNGDRAELDGYRFTRGIQNVVISYRAGYENVPEDLAQAVLEYTALRYRGREWGAASTRSVAGDSVTQGNPAAGSWAMIMGVVEKYRRVRL